MATKCAIASYCGEPELPSDERRFPALLTDRGLDTAVVVWDDSRIDWLDYGLVVIRTCWDYFNKLDAFLEWLDRLDGYGTILLNSSELIRWNLSKRYLLDLQRRGIPIVPSHFVPPGRLSARTVLNVASLHDWNQVVVKPTVGAWAHGIQRADRAKLATVVLDDPLYTRFGAIVQEYQVSIESRGEISLIFVGGQYSHTALKSPHVGDFRVQLEFGGSLKGTEPSAAEMNLAVATINQLSGTPAFARIDILYVGNLPCVSEVELIEPWLYADIRPAVLVELADIVHGVAQGR